MIALGHVAETIRPATISLALLFGVALGFVARNAMHESAEVRLATAIAECRTQQAVQARQVARHKLDLLERDLDDLGDRLQQALDDVVGAQEDADRAAARAKLVELQQEAAAMRERVDAAACRLPRATRGIEISGACIENPLAKGCM